MLFALLTILIVVAVFGPQKWVKYVLSKHSQTLDGMPGTGGELARHLLDRFELSHVKLEIAPNDQDHYDPEQNAVRLSAKYMDGKSLTAVAVAAHEVGHAIQFNRQEPVSYLRRKYMTKAVALQKIGGFLMLALPLVGLVFRVPHLMLLTIAIGVASMLLSVLLYLAILPEEWDASFRKALPILEQGQYLPDTYQPAVRQILKACALTYVAAALANILSLWRWLAILRQIR